jgi:hypothetical protein
MTRKKRVNGRRAVQISVDYDRVQKLNDRHIYFISDDNEDDHLPSLNHIEAVVS